MDFLRPGLQGIGQGNAFQPGFLRRPRSKALVVAQDGAIDHIHAIAERLFEQHGSLLAGLLFRPFRECNGEPHFGLAAEGHVRLRRINDPLVRIERVGQRVVLLPSQRPL